MEVSRVGEKEERRKKGLKKQSSKMLVQFVSPQLASQLDRRS